MLYPTINKIRDVNVVNNSGSSLIIYVINNRQSEIDWRREYESLVIATLCGYSIEDIHEHFYKNISLQLLKNNYNKWKVKEFASGNDETIIFNELCRRYDHFNDSIFPETTNELMKLAFSDPYVVFDRNIISKRDLLINFYDSRDNEIKAGIDYSKVYKFDLVPRFFNYGSPIVLLVNKNFGKSLEEDWIEDSITYTRFVVGKNELRDVYGKITSYLSSKDEQKIEERTKLFISKSENKFGKGFVGYDKTRVTDWEENIILKCPYCGQYFEQRPGNHLNSPYGCCSDCALKFRDNNLRERNGIGLEELIKRSYEIEPNHPYDFSEAVYINNKTKLKIINKETGRAFWRVPADFLRRGLRIEPNISRSAGEDWVERWLIQNSVTYFHNKTVEGIQNRKVNSVIIDFILPNYLDKLVWIEYNGRQHYKRFKRFQPEEIDFEYQLQRDENVRKYCKDNSIFLIEIPYTLYTYKSIKNFLDEVLLNRVDPNDLINYESLYEQ